MARTARPRAWRAPVGACEDCAVKLVDELEALIAALEARRAPYALAGGLAVAVWGAPRATADIDLLVREVDLPLLVEIARACGFVAAALPMRFPDGMVVRRITKLEGAEALTLDLLLVNENLEQVWQGRVRVPREGGEMSVVSREGLIQMKLTANRPQDIYDVQRLMDVDR